MLNSTPCFSFFLLFILQRPPPNAYLVGILFFSPFFIESILICPNTAYIISTDKKEPTPTMFRRTIQETKLNIKC